MIQVVSVKRKKKTTYEIVFRLEKLEKTYEISEDIMVEFRLVKEKILTKEQFKTFTYTLTRDTLYQKVLTYALYKMRTVKEIRTYLIKKEVPESEHEYYINKLKKVKIIDDHNYASLYVKEQFDMKLVGPRKIAHNLMNKGISSTLFQAYIDAIQAKDITLNLERLFQKKQSTFKDQSLRKATQSLMRYFTNKGYDLEDVNQFIATHQEAIQACIDEDASIRKDYKNALKKYHQKPDKANKIYAFLMRKGYDYSTIKRVIGEKIYE